MNRLLLCWCGYTTHCLSIFQGIEDNTKTKEASVTTTITFKGLLFPSSWDHVWRMYLCTRACVRRRCGRGWAEPRTTDDACLIDLPALPQKSFLRLFCCKQPTTRLKQVQQNKEEKQKVVSSQIEVPAVFENALSNQRDQTGIEGGREDAAAAAVAVGKNAA